MGCVAAERSADELRQLLGIAANRDTTKVFSVVERQRAVGDSTEAVRFLQYRIEDRGEVAGRGIDYLQYLGGRGLLFQRLARLSNQPRVLDRDHRLVGKRADQL